MTAKKDDASKAFLTGAAVMFAGFAADRLFRVFSVEKFRAVVGVLVEARWYIKNQGLRAAAAEQTQDEELEVVPPPEQRYNEDPWSTAEMTPPPAVNPNRPTRDDVIRLRQTSPDSAEAFGDPEMMEALREGRPMIDIPTNPWET